MKLYHYSSGKYQSLTTLEKRGQKYESKLPHHAYLPGRYDQSISFFFDPIPFTLLSSIYGKDHPVWFPGNKLFQYLVESDDIGDFKYHIVESPEKTELIIDDEVTTEDYLRIYPKIAKKKLYLGKGSSELTRGSKPFINKTQQYFINAPKIKGWIEQSNKYAAYVPHVMIYPSSGEIDYEEVSSIKIR